MSGDDFTLDDAIRAAEYHASKKERAFWAAKFRHWQFCQQDGDMISRVKGIAFGDCARSLEENDRWVPRGVSKRDQNS